jgi:hypothetical protein
MVVLRNFLMERASARTAQLVRHFSDVTGDTCGRADIGRGDQAEG